MSADTIAPEAEMLAAVERWARVRGFVMHDRDGYQPHDGKLWGLH